MILPLQVELQGMESIHGSLFYIGTVSDWRATEMAGWGRTLAAKPDNFRWWKESQLQDVL